MIDADLESVIARIAASSLFDESFYAEQAGIWRPRKVAIAHYLVEGERQGFRPCDIFDAAYYLGIHADVQRSGINALVHYLTYGQAEGRYPAVERDRQRRLRELIDAGCNEVDYASLKPIFDETYYRGQRPDLPRGDDALHDYLANGRWAGYSAARDFNHLYYISRYPDIDPARHEPLLHFLEYGRLEGRLGRPDFSTRIVHGGRRYDPKLETLLVVAHEASRTGAPLVALALGKQLGQNRNIIFASGRRGSLESAFVQASVITIVDFIEARDAPYLLEQLRQDYDVRQILLSSAETNVIAQAALHSGIASVGLIHEFAEYSFGKVGEMIAAVDVAIVPARIILHSGQAEMSRDWGGPANNICVHPQGVLPASSKDASDHDMTKDEIYDLIGSVNGSRPKIVLGAGFVHIRKGLDLFVQTAAELARSGVRDIRFIWVGEGYDPKRDPDYTLWIDDLIKRLGLSDMFFVIGAQSSLDVFHDAADLFFLSSRLDPFPNVALDAMSRGKPLLCFRESTGLAEWIDSGRVIGEAVQLTDLRHAAERIRAILDLGCDHGAGNAEVARSSFDFETYSAIIEEAGEQARRKRQAQDAITEQLGASGAFDPLLLGAGANTPALVRAALERYVAYSSKGLGTANPRPGFNDALYRARAGLEAANGEVPLDHAVRTSGSRTPATHKYHVLKDEPQYAGALGETAIILLDMPGEGLARIAASLAGAGRVIDLIVVIGPDQSVIDTCRLLKDHKCGTVTVWRTSRRDRQLHILLEIIAGSDRFSHYEVIGHIDGNTLEQTRDDDQALDFMTRTVGGITAILNLFADDPGLGLAFAEKGLACAGGIPTDLAERNWHRMGGPLIPPAAVVTPPNAIFWTRPKALAVLKKGAQTLLSTGQTISDAEPLRRNILAWLVPTCEQSKSSWLTLL